MRETGANGLFWRWGGWMYRLRWLIVIAWAVLFAVFAGFARQAPELMKDNGFTPKGSQSDIGIQLLQDKLGYPPSTVTLVYYSDELDLTQPSELKRIMDSLESVRTLPYVVDKISPNTASRLLTEGNEHVQSVSIGIKLNTDEALVRFPELRRSIRAPEGMNVNVTGGPPILFDMQEASKRDIAKAEMIGLPIALVVLLVVFGTLVGAVLPLIVGAMSVTVTLGISYFIAKETALSSFLPNMVTMLGLAVGIDYALFLVSRFREELRRGAGVQEAVAMTCGTAGQSIFYSGVAVLIGLFGMLFIDLNIYRSLCLGGVLVVAVSVLVANTLLPALLGILGMRINRLRVLPARLQRAGTGRLWETISRTVMKRPLLLAVLISLVLVSLAIPVAHMRLGVPSAGVLPPSYESRLGADQLDKTYDSREAQPIQLVVRTTAQSFAGEDVIQALQAYIDRVKQTEGVSRIHSFLDAFEGRSAPQIAAALQDGSVRATLEQQKLLKGDTALVIVIPSNHPNDKKTDQTIKDLRLLDGGSFKVKVTGSSAYRVDIVERINEHLPAVVGFVMVVTYFVLLWAFRSVLLPLKAVLMNLLSLGASLGVVVLVFQEGLGADALRITSTGYVSATLPVIIFCVVFGISMDYEVFLLSRIAEEYEATGDNDKSTASGLVRTGSLITSAAFILVVVVGSFIFTDIEIMKALGLGLGLAVLIDATIVRIVLVPALMKLLGPANWWAPRWLKQKVEVGYNKR